MDIKRRALHRSKVLQGQLKGLTKMIDEEEYCMDILTQGLAIQRSIASLNKLVLENHLRTHVSDMFKTGDTISEEKAITELLGLYELHNIRAK